MMMSRVLPVVAVLIFLFFISINQLTSYTHIFLSPKPNVRSTRVCCLILSTPKYFATRARAVNTTWAPRCDHYLFISEWTNDTKHLPIAPIANLTAGYGHLTQKTKLAFHYAYEHFIDKFDWFLKADDDTYIIMENLRSFLQGQNSSQPVTFGYNFKVLVPRGYHSGGAAYVLSREALRRFYQAYHESNSTCLEDGGRGEDVEIAACLRKKHVYPGKSIDQWNRERFHPLTFSAHFLGQSPRWLKQYAQNKVRSGMDCCSNTTISFHYVTPTQQYMFDKIRYGFRGES